MEFKHTPPSLSELRRLRAPVEHHRHEAKMKLSRMEKFAVKVTQGVGTIGFFIILSVWTFGWLSWNLWGPAHLQFDPAPAFVVWLFASNIIQLILLPLIMVGQNLESKFAEKRAEADYQINKKSEYEIEVVIAHLENQNELLLEMMRKIERR